MTNEIEIPDGLCTFNLLLASPWREFPIILVKKFNQIKITQKNYNRKNHSFNNISVDKFAQCTITIMDRNLSN